MTRTYSTSTKLRFFTAGCLALALTAIAIGQAGTVSASETVTDIAQASDAGTAEPSPVRLAVGEFSTGGITIGDSQDKVIETLGEPDQLEERVFRSLGRRFRYDGLELWVGEAGVYGAIATTPDFCMPSGVCPGDTVRSVMETLGVTNLYTDEKGTHLIYSPAQEETAVACSMEMYFNEPVQLTDVTIKSIELVCVP